MVAEFHRDTAYVMQKSQRSAITNMAAASPYNEASPHYVSFKDAVARVLGKTCFIMRRESHYTWNLFLEFSTAIWVCNLSDHIAKPTCTQFKITSTMEYNTHA